MTGSFSRTKGANAERDIISRLQPIVTEVYSKYQAKLGPPPILQRNTLQSHLGGFDIVGLEWLAIEVKRQEILSLPTWWKQATDQAGPDQTAVLMYRRSYKPWRVVMLMRARLPTTPEKNFFCPADIAFSDFLVYFRHRLDAELRIKLKALEFIDNLRGKSA